MKKQLTLSLFRICKMPVFVSAFVLMLFMSQNANALIPVTVSGTAITTPALAASYLDLATALSALNAITAYPTPGTIIFTCTGGNSETAPPTGFVIGSASLNPFLSATNTVTINKTGGAVTINAGVGTATPGSAAPDGMLSLRGADYITIDGLTFTDGNVANPATMEFGIGLFKANAGDGCNNNTIQNCTFNMQRINNANSTSPMIEGAVGILVINSTATAATTVLTPTNGGTLATNGTNSGNKFYTNTINSGNYGIGLSGFAASSGVGPTPTATTFLGDLANDIGGSAAGTGNTILNYGGGAITNPAAGIRANNQWSVNISFNTINNNDGAGVNHAITLRGIYGQAGTSANATISNNTITLQAGATTSTISAIENVIGSTAASNTISINANIIKIAYTTATTGIINAILNTSTAATININSNDIQGVASTSIAGTGTCIMISAGSTGGTLNTNSNTISNLSRSGASGTWRGIVAATPPTVWNCTSNIIDGLSWTAAASTGSTDGIYNLSSAPVQNINSNIIRNLSTPTTGTLTGVRLNTVTGTHQCNNNQIYNFSTSAGGAGGASFLGINSSNGVFTCNGNLIYSLNSTGSSGGTGGTIYGIQITGTTQTLSNNAIYDLSSTSTNAIVAGINVTGGTTNNLNNNLIGDLKAINSTGNNAVSGIIVAGGTTNNIFHNSVNIAATTASLTTFGTSGIYFSSSTPINNLRNNIFVNTSTPGPTGGFTAAIRYTTAPTSTNFPASNNNNFYYAGIAAANKVLYCEGATAAPTNGQQTIANYKTYISVTLPVSSRESASVSEIPNFVSTTGSNPITTFLKYNTGIATQIEQGGGIGTGITTDYAGATRCPGGGCPGAASTPDMGAWELAGLLLDLSAPSITYGLLGPTACTTSPRTLSNVTITDASTVNIAPMTRPRLYYRKSTDSNDLLATGWKYVEATGVGGSPFSFDIDYTLLFVPGVMVGDIIQYFVVAQDVAGTPNVGIKDGTFTTPPTSVALINANFPVLGANTYNITTAGLSGAVNVGGANPIKTLTETSSATGLFANINALGLSANTVVTLTDLSYTETGAVALTTINSSGCIAGTYTLTIMPAAPLTSLVGSVAGPLINLNGADNVTIDGASAGIAKDLTIRNTNTSGQTIQFINDATGNTIKNCIVEGVNSSSTSGTIVFSTTTGTLGNSNNIINNCDIKDGATVPANGVYSSGSIGGLNATNTVSGCNVFNWTNSGVLVTATGAGNGWTVNPSSFYQTASRTTALIAISILGGSGHTILSNNIGGSNSSRGGTALSTSSTFAGINLTVGTSPVTSVQDNKISNLNITGATSGTSMIRVNGGNVNIGTTTGNIIGGLASSSDTIRFSYDSYGIYNLGSGIVDIENNTIGNCAYYRNTNDEMRGILVEAGTVIIKNNVVRDLKSNANNATFYLAGIESVAATGGILIEGNQIYNLTQFNSTGGLFPNVGLYVGGATSGDVRKNVIYGINGVQKSVLYGIFKAGGSASYYNNMISITPTGADHTVFGIFDDGTSGSNNWYFNSAYISGSTSGTASSYAFVRNGTAAVNIKNNLLINDRTGGTGFHVALANINASATGWLATASDYNDLYSAVGSNLCQWLGSAVGNNRDLTGWRAAQGAGTPGSGGDATSVSIAPIFTTPTNLRLTSANGSLDNLGTPAGGIGTDIDGAMRNAVTPDMGINEFSPVACIGAVGGMTMGSTSFCGSGIPSITASSYSTGVGSSYQWQSSTDGFITPLNISGQTNPSSLTIPSVTTTTSYRLKVKCGAMDSIYSTTVTITINPSVASISGPSIKCTSDPSVSLMENGMTGISWSWSTGASTQSITVSPVSTTTYTVTVTSPNSCTAVASKTVTVNPNPTGVTAMASANPVCSNEPFNLTSSSTPISPTLLAQDFESGVGSWTLVNTSTGGSDPTLVAYTLRMNGYAYSTDVFTGNQATQFIMTNSDAAGSGVSANTTLTSPSFSTSGYATLTLTYKHYYRHITAAGAFTEVSTNGGSSWTTIQTYSATTGTAAAFASASLDLSAYVGFSDVQVRFRYTGAWYYYWAIDDIKLNGTSAAPTYAWSSSPAGFMSAVQNPMGVTQIVPTNYTVSVTNFGCSTTASTGVIGVNSIVTNTNNAGVGSLRDLIACAGDGGIITFDPSIWNSTITLTAPIVINKIITLSGPTGPDVIDVAAGGVPPVFNITSGNLLFIGNINIKP